MAVHRWDDASFDGDLSVTSSFGADKTLPDDGTLGSKTRRTNADSVSEVTAWKIIYTTLSQLTGFFLKYLFHNSALFATTMLSIV
jgi:hypothetical protein